MNFDVVIAKYKEDVSWVDNIAHSWADAEIRKFIYSKDENEDNPNYIRLPNVGREADTYLNHIIRNYDDLAEYTLFSQGGPKSDIWDICDDWRHYLSAAFDFDFFPLGHHVNVDNNWGYPTGWTADLPYILREFYKDIFGSYEGCPNYFVYTVGAIFVVKRDRIKQYSIQFYENLLGLLKK